MTKNILQIIFLILFCNQLYSQQDYHFVDCNNYLQYSSRVLFDQKSINPVYAGDSLGLKFGINVTNLLVGKLPYTDYNATLDLSVKSINSGVGFNVDYLDEKTFKYQRLSAFYHYRIDISDNLRLRIGTELGLVNSKYDFSGLLLSDPSLPPGKYSKTNPFVNIGTNVEYKIHKFGISFKNQEQTFAYDNGRNKLILDYGIHFPLSKSILVSPEIIDLFGVKSNVIVLLSKFNYKNKLTLGILYNSQGYTALSISCRFLKKFELGYDVDFYSKFEGNLYHSFFLKVLIK